MGIIKSAYKFVEDYIMQFDTKGTRTMHPTEGIIESGDGKLDEEELGFLKEDLKPFAVLRIHYKGYTLTKDLKAIEQ